MLVQPILVMKLMRNQSKIAVCCDPITKRALILYYLSGACKLFSDHLFRSLCYLENSQLYWAEVFFPGSIDPCYWAFNLFKVWLMLCPTDSRFLSFDGMIEGV